MGRYRNRRLHDLDELAVAKFQKIEEEIAAGKRKVFTEAEVKRKYKL